MSTLVHLPGTRVAPELVLARGMAEKANIKAVVIIRQNMDDTYEVDWSQMKVSEFCMASKVLDRAVAIELDTNHEPK